MSFASSPLPVLFFALCVAINYYIQERAREALSPEEFARIKAAWSAPLRWFVIAMGSLLALLLILSEWPDHPAWLFRAFFIALFVVCVAFVLLGLRRMSHLRLPAAYLRKAWMSGAIYLLGILVMNCGILLLLRKH